MAFQTITIGTQVFNSVGNGTYMRNDVPFGGLANGIKITPGRKNGPNAPTTASITRYLEMQDPITGKVNRLSISTQISAPAQAQPENVDALLTDIDDMATIDFVNRLLLGES